MTSLFVGLLLMISLPSNAHPGPVFPRVSIGENPRRSFGGSVEADSIVAIVTVPAGQELIVTLVATSTAGISPARYGVHGIDFVVDSISVLHGYILSTDSKKASIARGDGRLRIPEGQTLYARLQGPGVAEYYVQGFMVSAGSPYRSYNGTTAAYPTPIMSADPDRDFIVRTVSSDCPVGLGGSPLSVWVNGVNLVSTTTGLTGLDPSGKFESPLVQGKGSLVVPAGETLTLVGTPPCDYYIDGEYVTP